MSMTGITIADPHFPYLIKEEGRKSTSYVSIRRSRSDFGDFDSSAFFYVAGAEISGRDNRTGLVESSVQLRHSFACDDESDRSYVANFTFKALTPVSYGSYSITYAALLTEIQFYPIAEANPFLGAVQQDAEADHTANNGYPYLPPKVRFEQGLQLPLEVEVTLEYNRPDADERLQQIMYAHEAARVEKVRKQEEVMARVRIEAANSRAAHEAYLLTEDGQRYAVQRYLANLARAIPTLKAGEEADETELQWAAAQAGRDFGGAFTNDEIKLLQAMAADGKPLFGLAAGDEYRQAYRDAITALILGSS